MGYDEAYALVCKNEKVEVKPIVRDRSFFKKGHDGEFMFTGTVKQYQLPFSNGTRSYVKIFKDQQEQEAFEVLLYKEPGDFNIYNRDSKQWLKYVVEVTKEGKILDLTIPSHALEEKVLRANYKRISPDWDSRHKAGLEFALVNDSQLRESDNKKSDVIEKAMEYYFKVKKTNSKMYNLLRLLDKTPTVENKDNTAYLKNEVMKIIEQREKTKVAGLKTMYDFIAIMEDSNFDNKVLIFDAMDAKEIVISYGSFKLTATEAVMGNSIDQAAAWLNDLQNQESKIVLQQRLKK